MSIPEVLVDIAKGSGLGWDREDRAWASRHQSFSARAHAQSNFSGVSVLASLLGMEIEEGPSSDLRSAYQKLPEAQKQILQKKWNEPYLTELFSISQEKDSEMYWEQLLHLGVRLQQSGKLSESLLLFASVIKAREPTQGPSSEQVARAQEEAQALLGQGSSGRRFELLLGRVAEEATDLPNFLPIVGGSLIFQWGRMTSLAWLSRARGSFWATGWAARAAASVAAFSLEVPSFYLLDRGIRTLRGENVGHGDGHDFASLALTLATFKIFGLAGKQALRLQGFAEMQGTASLPRIFRVYREAVPAFAQISGLAAAHRLEESFGLRPSVENSTRWTDAFMSYLTLSAGASLASGILGPEFAKLEREMGLRAELFPELKERSLEIPAKVPKLSYLLPVTPLPMMIFMGSWSFERWFKWLTEDRNDKQMLLPENGLGEQTPVESPRQPITWEERTQLKRIFRRYPQIRKAMDKAGWGLEERRDLLNIILLRSSVNLQEEMEFISPAIRAMTKAGWNYPRQKIIFDRLCGLGHSPMPQYKQLPAALQALQDSPWNSDQKYDAILKLMGVAGRDVSPVFFQMTQAFGDLKKTPWTWEQKFEVIFRMVQSDPLKASVAMAHLATTVESLKSVEWSFEEFLYIFSLLVEKAPSDRFIEDFFEESLPFFLVRLEEYPWTPKEKFQWLANFITESGEELPGVLGYLPGVMDVLKALDWGPEVIRKFLPDLMRSTPKNFGKLLRVIPLVVQSMVLQGKDIESQMDMILALAETISEIPELAFVDFTRRMIPVMKKLNQMPN